MFFKVNIKPVSSEKMPSLRAFADITLDDMFVVRGLKIIEKQNKDLFVAMPQEKVKVWDEKTKGYIDGYSDRFAPLTKEARSILNENVLSQYNKHMSKNNQAINVLKENTVEKQQFAVKTAAPEMDAELGG